MQVIFMASKALKKMEIATKGRKFFPADKKKWDLKHRTLII